LQKSASIGSDSWIDAVRAWVAAPTNELPVGILSSGTQFSNDDATPHVPDRTRQAHSQSVVSRFTLAKSLAQFPQESLASCEKRERGRIVQKRGIDDERRELRINQFRYNARPARESDSP
jgi:hypothetical protein